MTKSNRIITKVAKGEKLTRDEKSWFHRQVNIKNGYSIKFVGMPILITRELSEDWDLFDIYDICGIIK